FESKGTSQERVVIGNTKIEAGYYSQAPMDIQYTDFNGGIFEKRGSGDLILKDSLLGATTTFDLERVSSTIERNTFKLNYLYMSIGSEQNHILKNNLFYRGFNAQSSQKIMYYGYEWNPGKTLLESNSF